MAQALDLFRYVLTKFINLIFTDLQIENSVTLGYVIISIILMGIIINSILNIPNNVRFNKKYNGERIKSVKGRNVNG